MFAQGRSSPYAKESCAESHLVQYYCTKQLTIDRICKTLHAVECNDVAGHISFLIETVLVSVNTIEASVYNSN